jgi:hypothetical protein
MTQYQKIEKNKMVPHICRYTCRVYWYLPTYELVPEVPILVPYSWLSCSPETLRERREGLCRTSGRRGTKRRCEEESELFFLCCCGEGRDQHGEHIIITSSFVHHFALLDFQPEALRAKTCF